MSEKLETGFAPASGQVHRVGALRVTEESSEESNEADDASVTTARQQLR